MIKDTALGHWRPDIRQESIEQAAPITPFSFKRKKLQPFKCGLNVAGVRGFLNSCMLTTVSSKVGPPIILSQGTPVAGKSL